MYPPPPNNNNNNGSANIFGIIGLVIACFSLLFSFIPCIGAYAIGPAVIAAAFCGIALAILKKEKQNTTVSLVGLIIGCVAILIGILQFTVFSEVYEAKDEINKALEEGFNEAALEKLSKEMEVQADSIQKAQEDTLNSIENDSVSW